MRDIGFDRDGERILTTGGTHFSGRITSLGAAGAFEVWHIAPGHVYSGLGRPWLRTQSRLLIVRVTGPSASVVKECKPGAAWAARRREFLDEIVELSGGPSVARVTFAREG